MPGRDPSTAASSRSGGITRDACSSSWAAARPDTDPTASFLGIAEERVLAGVEPIRRRASVLATVVLPKGESMCRSP